MKKEAEQTSARGTSGSNPEARKLIYFIAISAVLHLVFMAGIILAPALAPAKRYIPTVVNVSLVSLPALGNATVETVVPEKQEVQDAPAEKVEVTTKSADPEAAAWRWTSDGKNSFKIEPAPSATKRGTSITAYLREDAEEFSEPLRVRTAIEKYSNFVPFPIELDGETVNTISAIWREPKSREAPQGSRSR